ncbi:GntR family transcriptional regulator [Microbacterium pumilum]|uniref:GntR family transcriptional regulator n=1 Tax=Microbacterium pumilum TaxID=344165 RepID=A0ABP5EFV4_9MICO
MSLSSPRTAVQRATSIYEVLRERLVSGEYPQGARISVEEVRAELAVSKQPVMQALRQLSADGLVEIIPQVGSVASIYPVREIADFYDVFAGIEGAAAAAAASRRDDEQLSELREISTRIASLRGHPDPGFRSHHYRNLNRDFHGKIHEMARSQIIVESSRRMWDLSDFLIATAGATQPLAGAIGSRHHDHEEVRNAIEQGDADEAREQMASHIRGTFALIFTEVTNINLGRLPR